MDSQPFNLQTSIPAVTVDTGNDNETGNSTIEPEKSPGPKSPNGKSRKRKASPDRKIKRPKSKRRRKRSPSPTSSSSSSSSDSSDEDTSEPDDANISNRFKIVTKQEENSWNPGADLGVVSLVRLTRPNFVKYAFLEKFIFCYFLLPNVSLAEVPVVSMVISISADSIQQFRKP